MYIKPPNLFELSFINSTVCLFVHQEYEAAVKQMELDKSRVEHEERRKSLAAETEHHQKVDS